MKSGVLEFLSGWGLVGTFVVLFLSGLGLPIPEEVTLLTSGYVASTGAYHPFEAAIVAILAILLGDSIVYWIGHRWGRSAIHGPVRRILSEERIAKAEAAFHRNQNWFLFGARFVAGVRMVAYFTAGMLRVSYWRFLLLDLCGALISGPTSIYAAYYLGKALPYEELQKTIHHYRNWGAVIVLGIILLILAVRFLHKRLNASLVGR